MVRLLLKYSANPNSKDDEGWTPLIIAAESNHIDIAKILLNATADINLTHEDG